MTIEVTVQEVKFISTHPNADKLDIATICGWECVVGRDTLNAGDKVVYFPVDSVLPFDLEQKLLHDSKIKLSKGRIKATRIRGFISQGLAIPLLNFNLGELSVGQNVAEVLGVVKYEEPERNVPCKQKNPTIRKHKNPNFHEYTTLLKVKFYPDLWQEGEEVIITEKIHGTNFRAGWVAFSADTLWKKIKKFLHLAPKWEYIYGSHRVQHSNKKYNGWYKDNVYMEASKKYELQSKCPKGFVIYGEVYGSGIQKGYTYGCAEGERKLIIFDVYDSVKKNYLDWKEMACFCEVLGLPYTHALYQGPYNKNTVEAFVGGESVLCSSEPVREGIILRSKTELPHCTVGRKIMKLINPVYLLGDNSEHH